MRSLTLQSSMQLTPKGSAKLIFFCFLTIIHQHIQAQEQSNYQQLSYPEIDSLAEVYYQADAYHQLRDLLEVGKKKAELEFGKQDTVYGFYVDYLGFTYGALDQYNKALSLHLESIKIWEETFGQEHPYFTISLNNIAVLHENMENYDLALPLYQQAVNIEEKTLGQNHPDYASSLSNLALLYNNLNKHKSALSLLLKAHKIWEKTLEKDDPLFAISYHNLAGSYKRLGNTDLALDYFKKALDIRKKIAGTQHPDYANSLNNLAILYEQLQNFELALELFQQSEDIFEKTLGANHHLTILSTQNIARLYYRIEQYELGWKVLKQSIDQSSFAQLQHNFDQAWADSLLQIDYPSNEHILGLVYSLELVYTFLSGDSSINNSAEKQMVIVNLANNLLEIARNQVISDKDKLRMLSNNNDWLQMGLHTLTHLDQAQQAFQLSDQNKSVLLLENTKSEEAYRLGNLPDSLVRLHDKMQKERDILQAKLYEKRPKKEKETLRNELIEINQEIEDWEMGIKSSYPKYYKLRYQQKGANTEEIQASLDANTVLLEYVISDSTLHIFSISKTALKWTQQLINRTELNYNIQRLHTVLSDYTLLSNTPQKSYTQYTELAHWFYQNLIEPALKETNNISDLIIIPDGELGHLPFETFLTKAAPKKLTSYQELPYLLNQYNISYNYSATSWKENIQAPKPQNNGQILGMAANYKIALKDINKTDRTVSDTLIRNVLNPLPAARTEVEALQAHFKGFFAFDTLASEKTIKQLANDYAVIHLAMHGLPDIKHPMFSSLAFTEDSDSIENNFWQVHEISKMHLNADLVVLSACETGYGKFEKGNGIASLARAFMYAGASSLIVSLWKVNDVSTAQIMQNLYKNLSKEMPKDKALHQAKLQYIQQAEGAAAHPAYWSPFIQIGNTKAMTIQSKNKNSLFWWIIGGSSLIFLFFVTFSFRKQKNS